MTDSNTIPIPEKHKNFIKQVSRELTPTASVSLLSFFGKWLLLSLLSGLIGILTLHLRPDFFLKLSQVSFYTKPALLFLGISLLIYGELLSGIPGQIRLSSRFFAFGALACSAWILFYLIPILTNYFFNVPMKIDSGIMCSIRTLGLSILPLCLCVYLIRKLAPTRLSRSGIGAFAIPTFFGNLVMMAICPASDPVHIVIWHILPISLMAGFGALFGEKVLKW